MKTIPKGSLKQLFCDSGHRTPLNYLKRTIYHILTNPIKLEEKRRSHTKHILAIRKDEELLTEPRQGWA